MNYKRILLSNHYLCNYAGSELLTLEKARYFKDKGCEVYVAFFEISERLKKDFDFIGVEWVDLNRSNTIGCKVFDLFWGHHFTTFNRILIEYGLEPKKVVFSSLSPYEALECPPVYFSDLSGLTANSRETAEELKKLGVNEEDIFLFENSVQDFFFEENEIKKNRKLKKIAVISNHIPRELIGAVDFLKNDYDVDLVGVQYTHILVTKEILSSYDLVITIGRTVQQCFALGVPVYCYDRFGGPGYLNENNFLKAADFNFSGRCTSIKLSDYDLAKSVVSGYEQALLNLEYLMVVAQERFTYSVLMSSFLNFSRRKEYRGVSSGLCSLVDRQLSFYAGLNNKLNESREASDIEYWLGNRTLSCIQKDIVDEVVFNSGNKVSCGIIIFNFDNNEYALLKSRERIEKFQKNLVGLSLSVLCLSDRQFFVDQLNDWLYRTDNDWLLVMTAGEELTISGLTMMQIELSKKPILSAISFDEIYCQDDGSFGAALRPASNLDYLLSFPAGMSRHWLFNRQDLLGIGGFNAELADAFELDAILRLINTVGLGNLGHISEPLIITASPILENVDDERKAIESHLRERGYENAELQAPLPGRYRVWYGHPDVPLVSILIPTKNQLAMVQRCVESILEITKYQNYEIIIIDNDSDEPDAIQWLDAMDEIGGSKVRVLRYRHPFNFSAMNNFAASEAVGEYLLLLNNDTAIIEGDWLDNMLNHGLRPEVGIVGAKLLFPNRTVQHAGVVLGLNGPAEHPFINEKMDAPGYMQRLQVDQNYSAVTAACLLIRKEVYFSVYGMDEEVFKVSYNDVDLCLKVREQGYLIVWTPHAVLLHEGSVSQSKVDTAAQEAKRKRFVGEQDAMYAKWLPQLARDPAYNPNFSLTMPGGFKLADSQISWRPLEGFRPSPVALVHPADLFGCGHYRVIQPFLAMKEAGLFDGAISTGLMHVTDLERYSPDTIILQRQIGDQRIEAMQRMQRFSKAFKVYELDDYLPNLPLKSVHRANMPKDILRSLRKGLGFVDRFVVSTEALAEAFSGLHGEIVVMENRLPVTWWQGLQTQRNQGKKPRVGWAGGAGHTGDLELIADVVRDLADEVEWVFFGMCPDKLRPYVHEYHDGVAIEQYPAKLASLNLDLGLAPLEMNLFNECKSNLRLLEYGACGIPVVCTDIRCYQNDFPVTRVRNRYKDWVEAIRLHINDLDAAAKLGDELQAKVRQEWMLEGVNLELWRKAWLPS